MVPCSDAAPATTAAAATPPRKHPVAEQVAALLAVARGALHHVPGGKAPGAVHDLLLLLLLLTSGRLLMLLRLSCRAAAGLVASDLGVYFEDAAVGLCLLHFMLACDQTAWLHTDFQRKQGKAHRLVVERLNDALRALSRGKNHFHHQERLRLDELAADHFAANGRHGALHIRRRRARRKVLPHDGKRAREAANRDAVLLLLLLLLRCRTGPAHIDLAARRGRLALAPTLDAGRVCVHVHGVGGRGGSARHRSLGRALASAGERDARAEGCRGRAAAAADCVM